MARGSRRSSSRLVGLLEPFTCLHAQFARGRNLDSLTQARAIRSFGALRRNLDLLAYGSYLLELWTNCLPFREPARRPFALLVTGLGLLGQEEIQSDLLCRWLELHLVDELGYGPQLSSCRTCGRAPREGGVFHPDQGEVTCASCSFEHPPGAFFVSWKAVVSVHHLRRLAAAQLAGRRPPPELGRELERLLRSHLQHHWPQHLKSLTVFKSLVGRAV